MQMSKTYESTNRKKRAEAKRKDALECERAGFPMMAALNWEEAAFLDPPKFDEDLPQ
jgi:hypothetical protein